MRFNRCRGRKAMGWGGGNLICSISKEIMSWGNSNSFRWARFQIWELIICRILIKIILVI